MWGAIKRYWKIKSVHKAAWLKLKERVEKEPSEYFRYWRNKEGIDCRDWKAKEWVGFFKKNVSWPDP